jgi:multidrug resistance efflux pump
MVETSKAGLEVDSGIASAPSYLDQTLWRQMQDAPTLESFVSHWLAIQCTLLNEVQSGLVMTGDPDQSRYSTSAAWSAGDGASHALIPIVELAIQERRGVLKEPPINRQVSEQHHICYLAYPILVTKKLYGAVGLEITVTNELEIRKAMRQLQWGIAWIEVWIHRERKLTFSPANNKAEIALEVLIASLEHTHFQASATAAVTELAILTECDKVCIGFKEGEHIKVKAVSHSAQFSHKSNLIHAIGSAMEEAADQHTTLIYPPPSDNEPKILYAHEKLARELDKETTLCTIPLSSEEKIFGGMTFERNSEKPFDAKILFLLETIAALLGPVLDIKRREDQSLLRKALDALRLQLEHLLGPGHTGLKLSGITIAAAILFFSFARMTYYVSAETHIEGAIQRAVAAPMQGFISAAYVRAGDVVTAGQLLYTLDDRDLVLERLKWESQRDQYLKQYRDALAKSERAETRILGSQLKQAEAQIKLLNEQLIRTKATAPFDAVVVSGDLSQSLQSPVDKGDVLFELAPLDAYRVILEVDESDIVDIKEQQAGKLVLTGESKATLPFIVEKVTPVAETREGLNYFRVESKLTETPRFLRPGMKGIGKIEVGSRKIIWIWTHHLIDWWRLWWWKWLP